MIITGTANDDVLNGGDADDSLVGGDGSDVLTGGAGNDTIDGGNGTDAAVFTLAAGTTGSFGVRDGTGANAGKAVVVLINGVAVEEVFVIAGGGSQVSIQGLGRATSAGTDSLTNVERLQFGVADSAPNNLTLILTGSQTGASVAGSLAPDTINLANFPGATSASGNNGNDVITGTSAANTLNGNAGHDTMDGAGGNDVLTGGADADSLHGGDGDDLLIGGLSQSGGPQAGDGPDILRGEAGNDTLRGGDGDDILEGGVGDDNIRGDAGSDTIDGGAGTDFVSYNFSGVASGVVFDARALGAANTLTIVDPRGGVDTLISIESIGIVGSSFNDVIYGSNIRTDSKFYSNQIVGGLGNDQIFGGVDNDLLEGGEGNDTIDGGAGLDVAVYLGARSSYDVSRSGGAVTVRDLQATGEGSDILTGIERLGFADGVMGLVAERLVVLQPSTRDLLSWDSTLGSNGFSYLVRLGSDTNIAAVADLTGDGRADLLLQQPAGGLLRWDLTLGGNGFSALAAAPGFTVVGSGDLVGNGISDVLLRNTAGQLRVLDPATNMISDLLTMAQGWNLKGVGNINGTGKADLVFQNETSGVVIALTDQGWSDLITLTPSSGLQIAGFGDVVGGLADDLVFRNSATGVTIFWDVTQGGQGFRDFATIPQGWNLLTISDLNGDGRDDVAFQNVNGQAIYWTGTNWADLGSTLAGAQLQGTGLFA